MKIDFVSYSHLTAAQRSQQQKEHERQQIFLNKKYEEYLKELNGENFRYTNHDILLRPKSLFYELENENDIKNSVEQLNRCIEILVPKSEDLFTNDDFNMASCDAPRTSKQDAAEEIEGVDDDEEEVDDDDDFVEVPSKKNKEEQDEDRYVEMRYFGMLDSAESAMSLDKFKDITVDLHLRENDENKVVIEIMRDLHKELKKSYLAKINNWIKVVNNMVSDRKNLYFL